ncbi:response regulator transcription factor [Streptomyces chartreusis]|uniref:response regulator transcription factor n=1 Tax=Streptomyces chartreusis TaxID=1969 RepID=UPI003721CAC1
MTRVLVVEDDPQLVRALVINMQARRYGVDAAPDGATALRLAAACQPDVVMLDLGLPDMDGVDVIRALRGWTRAPILVLSARRASEEKVVALDAGADDYVTKPFSMDELMARLRAAVRRTEETPLAPERTLVETDEFVIDLRAKKVARGDREVRLTRGSSPRAGDPQGPFHDTSAGPLQPHRTALLGAPLTASPTACRARCQHRVSVRRKPVSIPS